MSGRPYSGRTLNRSLINISTPIMKTQSIQIHQFHGQAAIAFLGDTSPTHYMDKGQALAVADTIREAVTSPDMPTAVIPADFPAPVEPEDPDHQIAIVVKYHGPMNTRGSRFSMKLPHWDNKTRFAEWDPAERTDSGDQAIAFLRKHGITVSTRLDLGDRYALGVSFKQANAVKALFGISAD